MSSVQSIERAFAILRALAVGPSGVSEIATQVSLPKSTVSRMLTTLEGLGVVERLGDSPGYRIGAGIAELVGSANGLAALSVAVRPHLARLADQTGEAAGFSVPDGYSVHYLTQTEGSNPVQVRDYSGLVAPMHVAPSGLCMMAHWPAEEVQRYLSRPLAAFTAHTGVDPEVIVERLETIRRQGFLWMHEEYAEGISSVASPVFDQDRRVLGAIHVHGPTYRFPQRDQAKSIGRLVREAAEAFSQRTGATNLTR